MTSGHYQSPNLLHDHHKSASVSWRADLIYRIVMHYNEVITNLLEIETWEATRVPSHAFLSTDRPK